MMEVNIHEFNTPDFYSLISEKTKDFVGRKWVFDEIDSWLSGEQQQNKPKYFILIGKAGTGKSAIAAKLIEILNRRNVKENNGENKYISNNIKKKDLSMSLMLFHLKIIVLPM